jgi:hypothetical protein
VFTNLAYESFTLASHDLAVREQEWIWVVSMIVTILVMQRGLLGARNLKGTFDRVLEVRVVD